jgi:glycosyltransferase involved in cell wall biosynthesis
MKKARYLIIPSICYENLPLTLVEAFSLGLPVIATGLGSLENLVSNRHTGLHFRAGETQDLANKCTWLWQNPQEAKRMGQNARYEYEEKYTPQENYRQLMAIYHQVLEESHSRSI